jgi:hypothetical protein
LKKPLISGLPVSSRLVNGTRIVHGVSIFVLKEKPSFWVTLDGKKASNKLHVNCMPNPKQTDPHDVAVAAIEQAYEQLGRADEQFAFGDERVFKSEQDAARHPSDQQMRCAVPDRRSSRGRPALLSLIGLLLAACISVAVFARQSSYGDAAKLIITWWAPQRVSTSSLSLEKQEVPAQPIPPTVDVAQRLQTIARDLANVEQGIEQLQTSQEQMVRDNAAVAEQLQAAQAQMARDNAAVAEQLQAAQAQMGRDNAALAELKASQEQMARDNAAVAEQFKTSQEQMARLIAKASEQNLRPPPRPIATPKPKPVPTLRSPQARAQPQAPIQLQSEEQ